MTAMTTRAGAEGGSPGGARWVPVYGDLGSAFAPGLRRQVPVLTYLLRERRASLWHFFFAPNPRASLTARYCARWRGRPTVQTVCSAPASGVDLQRVLFGDRVVVLSEHTRMRFENAGISPQRLVHIPPAVPLLEAPSADESAALRRTYGLPIGAPLIMYPGDLEFSQGAARSLWLLQDLPVALGAHLLFCCREKTPAAQEARAHLQTVAERAGVASRVHFVGETPDIHGLLAAADLVVLPAETLYAKMDLPLVLLEAMGLGRPVMVLEQTPAAELALQGGAEALSTDRGQWAARASHWLEQGDDRAALGARARRVVAERYDPEVMAAAYGQVYEAVLGESPRGFRW